MEIAVLALGCFWGPEIKFVGDGFIINPKHIQAIFFDLDNNSKKKYNLHNNTS